MCSVCYLYGNKNLHEPEAHADFLFPLINMVTDHTGFYERYGWEFYCMAQGDGEDHLTRLYIHR